MRQEQLPIAAWIRATLAEKGWTVHRWANATNGKVNAQTIRRAMSHEYESVTSLRVVSDLAKAADVDMPALVSVADIKISEACLCEMLSVVIAVMDAVLPDQESIHRGARLLRRAIVFVQENPEVASDPKLARLTMLALSDNGER
jgi:hypothetical protein